MYEKGIDFCIKIKDLSPGQANIIKQDALSVGADAAVCKGTVSCKVDKTDVLILSNKNSLKKLISKLKKQPLALKDLAGCLREEIVRKDKDFLKLRDRDLKLDKPVVMGILNVTPDSFSDGGKYVREKEIIERLNYFNKHNVPIVDIGGESTRPGSDPVDAEEEFKRIEFAVKEALNMGFIVSIDTYKSLVAQKCLEMGAHLINDISGFRFDPDMPRVCADYKSAVCLMHIKGTPKDMQKNPTYENILEEIKCYLEESIELALNAGIEDESIIIDPGFGFGKTLVDNYIILKYLKEFKDLGYPLLVGVSRKSMIGNVLDKGVDERLVGTKVIETIAAINGADIIRTHDVAELNDVIKLCDFYNKVELNA
ncbi:dihydropteroate synthase [Deferribacter autotrophicus]|uniref:dihydropteroate synthase n=2 Tax=Deferribacter autotrophicus TaxID=500465 RepID=A0A5A8F7V2_9BACT|nr:dihydropteroate synthase [Deferribacter autotrophicus]